MRKLLATIACASALTVPAGNVWAATQVRTAQHKKVVTISRSVTGPLVDVDRWGQLQVSIKVTLTTTTVGARTDRSAYISSQALPLLRQEVLEIKGSTINLVSGATDTSYAFVDALRGALSKAGV